MLISIVDSDKTLLALKLLVDSSPMFDVIVEPLAWLDPLEEGWEVSSVESDIAEVADDDFMPGLSKNDWMKDFLFLICCAHYQHEILGHL